MNRRGYDQVLELFSRPFMRRCAEDWRFGPERVADDGVRYNLEFDAWKDALLAWRFPDMTEHVEYLADIVRLTIEEEMHKETGYLRNLRLARERVKRLIEGPDAVIDRIVRSVRDNGGKISNKLIDEVPALADEGLAAEGAEAVQAVFQRPRSYEYADRHTEALRKRLRHVLADGAPAIQYFGDAALRRAVGEIVLSQVVLLHQQA